MALICDIDALGLWLRANGFLHDVEICRLDFNSTFESVTIGVTDVNAAFADGDNYRPDSKTLVFHGIRQLAIDIAGNEGVRIGRASHSSRGHLLLLHFDLNLGGGDLTLGRGSFRLSFEKLEIY